MLELKCCGKYCDKTHEDSGYDYYVCRVCNMKYAVLSGEDLFEE